MLGFCGAQRVGKTTLAKAYAESTNSSIQFVATNTRQVFTRLGVSPKEQYPIDQRLTIQSAILEELRSQWKDNKNAVFDRTPLDVLAYMEADVLRDFPSDSKIVDQYMTYRKQCLDAINLFDAIVLVQPGIPIIEDPLAAPGSLPYMEHFNSLCLAYMHAEVQPRGVTDIVLDRDNINLEERIDAVKFFLSVPIN